MNFQLTYSHIQSNFPDSSRENKSVRSIMSLCLFYSVVLYHNYRFGFTINAHSISTSVVSVRVPPALSSGVLMRMSQSTTKIVPDGERRTFSSCITANHTRPPLYASCLLRSAFDFSFEIVAIRCSISICRSFCSRDKGCNDMRRTSRCAAMLFER